MTDYKFNDLICMFKISSTKLYLNFTHSSNSLFIFTISDFVLPLFFTPLISLLLVLFAHSSVNRIRDLLIVSWPIIIDLCFFVYLLSSKFYFIRASQFQHVNSSESSSTQNTKMAFILHQTLNAWVGIFYRL